MEPEKLSLTPLVRIGLYMLSSHLISRGWLSAEDAMELRSSPELMAFVDMAIGAVVGSGTFLWYWAAKRLGWST